jgi:AcrR family transcriptional regulator
MRDYDGKTAAERVIERREKLIDAGTDLFGEHGFAGTSIRAVLRQAGLIDRYWVENFADLDSLLAAVYDRLIDEEVAACSTAIDKTYGGSEGARAMITTIADFLHDDPHRSRIHLCEVLSGGPVSREQRRKGFYRLAQLVADLLPAAPLRGDSRQRLMLGVGVVAAADEYLRAWLYYQESITRDDVIDLVMLVFDSVAARLTRVVCACESASDAPTAGQDVEGPPHHIPIEAG